jgi:hypothetical protein
MDGAELLVGLRRERFDGRPVGDVRARADRAGAERARLVRDGVGRLLVDVRDDDVHPRVGEREHRAASDPAAAPGDDGRLPAEILHVPPRGSRPVSMDGWPSTM